MAESPPSSNGTSTQPSLKTTYSSPTNAPFTLTQPLPAPTDKTAYLAALRKATSQMQEHINKELTSRMEEDKALAGGASKGGVDEANEEDNYGEEVPEED
jgi:hypothetical protein